MKHLGDITKIRGSSAEPVNVIIGGSPCQDLSVAGKRAGLEGERSGLFMDQLRIIKEMRFADEFIRGRKEKDIRPRFMVWENVPGALSSPGKGHKGEDFQAVLTEIVKLSENKAPDVPLPDKGGALGHIRMHLRWRGKKMEYCLENIRCAVLGSPPASP